MSELIRDVRPEDFSGIQALNGELFAFETTFSQEYNVWWMYEERGIEYFLRRLKNDDDNSILFVAEKEERLVGYVCGYVDFYSARSVNKIAEIENMIVEDQFRNRGIGKALVDAFLEKAGELGAKKAKVAMLAGNTSAENFYRKMGFSDHELMLERKIS